MIKIGKITFALILPILFGMASIGPDSLTAQEANAARVPIRYSVDLSDARNHYVTISATFPAEPNTTELMMAVWTPGSYMVREFARHIDSMEVTSDGKKLKFEKTKKNRWTVQTEGVDSFQVKYRLYCNEMSVRTNWVGRQYAMLNGAPTFLTRPDCLDRPHVVELILPKSWTRSATSLRAKGDGPHVFVAESFDELVDSPIVAGNVSVYPFTAGGVEHQLVNVGESGYWDGTKAASDLKKIVESHQVMWDVIPYNRYLFLNMISENGGGLEHDNSTLIMTSRWTFRDEDRYQSWLGLASHEFFHTWNVRRLRPKTLVEYDYENEVYTDSLWIAEGITSYYEDLALVRAGLISRDEFLSSLTKSVESVQRTGGRKIQSLKDSSYDAWIKFYRPDDNSSNTRISYYSKGAVVAFLLDAKIRKATKGKKSLDDVMQKMFSLYLKSGYTHADFQNTASEVAGVDLTDWFSRAIESTEELDYSDIEALGIVVPNQADNENKTKPDANKPDTEKGAKPGRKPANKKRKSKKKSKEEAIPDAEEGDAKDTQDEDDPEKKKDETPPEPKPWLGFSSSSGSGRVTASGIKPNSPASDVGLNNGDEIIAINGFRVTGSIDSRLKQYKVGDEIELLIARRGKLITLRMTIAEKQKENWKLKFIAKPSTAQKKQLDLWLPGEKDD